VGEMSSLQTVYTQESAKPDGAVLLTVNVMDSISAVKSFMTGHGYTMPALVDLDSETAIAYGVSNIPHTVFIDRRGVIKAIKIGAFVGSSDIRGYLNKITK
jgi:hypothetical protein